MNAANPVDANRMVLLALIYWYQYKSMRTNKMQDLQAEVQAASASAGPQTGIRTVIDTRTYSIRDPMSVRVVARVIQRVVVTNRSLQPMIVEHITGRAKRHIASRVTTNLVSTTFDPAAPVVYAVGDDYANQNNPPGGGSFPAYDNTAGAAVAVWNPAIPLGAINLVATKGPAFFLQANTPVNQWLFQLRQWHAQEQLTPWKHPLRIHMPYYQQDVVGGALIASGVQDIGGILPYARETAGGADIYNTAQQSAAAIWTGGQQQPSNSSTSTTAWYPTAIRNLNVGEAAGTGNSYEFVQASNPPSSVSAPQPYLWTDYEERWKGIIDRFFRRSSYRVRLPVGGQHTFTRKTYLKIRPFAQNILGWNGNTAAGFIGSPYQIWTGVNQSISGAGTQNNAVGMAFGDAIAGGALGIDISNVNPGYEYYGPRLMYCKRTDPMGSPGTTVIDTLIAKGAYAVQPATASFTNSAIANMTIKRTTHWCTRMYVKTPRKPIRPRVITNDQSGSNNQTWIFPTYPASGLAVSAA